jgi:tetraacyldisaccharide 4'-kinase
MSFSLKKILRRGDLLFFGKRYSQKKGVLPFCLRSVLRMISFFWNLVSKVRNYTYDLHILPVGKVSACVVSVGNIVAGGTGKTPFTLFLAKKLIERGCKIAILSRGYGSSSEQRKLSKEVSLQEHWIKAGDEPLLFKQRLKEFIDVIVGKDRFASAEIAVRKGSSVLLLDDGMQARFIHRDLEVTLLNRHDLFGQDAFLPFGSLREHPKELKRSDFLIVNHVQSSQEFENVKERLLPFTKAPLIGVRPFISSIKNLLGQEVFLKEKTPLALFCGIGEPSLFQDLVKGARFSIVQTLFLPDHGFLSYESLLSFASFAKERGATSLLCTEKDKVKIHPKAFFPLPIYYVEMDLQVVEGKERIEELVQKIIDLSDRAPP